MITVTLVVALFLVIYASIGYVFGYFCLQVAQNIFFTEGCGNEWRVKKSFWGIILWPVSYFLENRDRDLFPCFVGDYLEICSSDLRKDAEEYKIWLSLIWPLKIGWNILLLIVILVFKILIFLIKKIYFIVVYPIRLATRSKTINGFLKLNINKYFIKREDLKDEKRKKQVITFLS